MSKTTKRSLGVDYHLPDGKGGYKRTRFATMTIADSAILEAMAERGSTWRDALRHTMYPSPEQLQVIATFVAEGYGDELMSVHLGGAQR